MSEAELVTAESVLHAMDYGQFTITGADPVADELALLPEAQDHAPSAGDGRSILVLSPHQNNFAMNVAVELWSDRPPRDDAAWQQVSVERLTVGADGTARLGSPTMEDTPFSMQAGSYWLEISGRGFVNYGWPGSTEPGDEWRLRFWPAALPADDVRKVWQMPGYGTSWGTQPSD